MTAFKSSPLARKDPLRVGLPLSLVIHAVLLAVILSSNAPHPPSANIITVTLDSPRTLRNPQKEIVSPPLQKSLTPPENTNKLSDSDSVAVKEQVKRGDNGGSPGAPSAMPQQQQQQQQQKPVEQQPPKQQQQQPAPPQPKQQQQPQQPAHEPSKGEHPIKNLKLDDATLAMKFGSSQAPRPSQQSAPSRSSLSDYRAFSRPPGSGATFVGAAGISDHLPNLPDGDITMLNAKANTYASFVRRVAVQVFTQLRSQGWERLSRQQVQQLGDFTTVEAVMSRDGKLMGVKVQGSSGSSEFDSVVQLSVKAGAQDPNPPPGAEAQDGLIHFIFKARSWSQMGVNPRSGMASEHRWLLLATGLE